MRAANNPRLDHGLLTIRVTKARLRANPDREAARLQRLLSRCAQRRW